MKKYSLLIMSAVLVLCVWLTGVGSDRNSTSELPGKPVSESSIAMNEDIPAEGEIAEEEPFVPKKLTAGEKQIIDQIITYYGCYGSKAESKVNALLDRLGEYDGRQSGLWGEIIDYWDYVNHNIEINTASVPKGLPKGDNLCIVVLGYELNANGSMQSELKGRLKYALSCARQYPQAYVFCTGGGTARFKPGVTEADVMGEWLLDHGLEQNRLIKENKSITTTQNAVFCHDIMLERFPQIDSVILISSSYHIPWGALMFEAEFMKSRVEKNTSEIHVISNYAYSTSNNIYKTSEILRWQTAGLLELAGNNQLAKAYYYNYYTKPKL